MGKGVRSFATRKDDRALEFTSERGAKQGKNARFWRDEALSARGVDPVGEAHLHNLEANRIYIELIREAEQRYAAERAAAAAANKAAASVPVPGVAAAVDGDEHEFGGSSLYKGAVHTADAAVAEERDDEEGGGDDEDTEEDDEDGDNREDVLVAVNAGSDSTLGESVTGVAKRAGDAAGVLVAVNAAAVSALAKEDGEEEAKRASAVGKINDDEEVVDDYARAAFARDAVAASALGEIDDDEEVIDDNAGVAFARDAVAASAVGGDKEEEEEEHGTGNAASVAVAVDAAFAPC